MKKQLILTLVLTSFMLNACETTLPTPIPVYVDEPFKSIAIKSFFPLSASAGSTVAIFGDNFGPTTNDNTFSGQVTFNEHIADLVSIQSGIVVVHIPPSLEPGEYLIRLSFNGQFCSSKTPFKVIKVNQLK